MQDQTSPEKPAGKLRRWLVKTGLIPPPRGEEHSQKLTDQQRKARQDLTWHQLRPPRSGI